MQQVETPVQHIPQVATPMKPRADDKYNPWKSLISDDKEVIYKRLYDAKYQRYLKESLTRIAHQLALLYFRDANPETATVLSDFKTGNEVVLLHSDEPGIAFTNTPALLFGRNCIPHTRVNPESWDYTPLSPETIVILANDAKLSEYGMEKLRSFVMGGGFVFSFNKAITLIDSLQPGKISYKNGETTIDKNIKIQILESPDKNLFLGLENASQRDCVARLAGTRRVSVNPEVTGIDVLVTEVHPDPCVLSFKMQLGSGIIFHMLPIGSNEVLAQVSTEHGQKYCKQVEAAVNISEQTKSAWKTAYAAGQYESFYLAISLLPLIDAIFGAIKKYKKIPDNLT